MEERLREERRFLRSVARGDPPEPPSDRRDSRTPPLVPEPLAHDADLHAPGSPKSPR